MNINFAECNYGKEERDALDRVHRTKWLGAGKEVEAFEEEFARYVGVKYCISCNSGSSANLLALKSLGLSRGDKVLTSAAGFPMTIAPIFHLGLIPIFVDFDIQSLNPDMIKVATWLETYPELKAVILAHTLGNPFNLELLENMTIPLIEDACEAVGAHFKGRHVGSIGKIGTFSFYPAHQMTCDGFGGALTTDDESLMKELKSLRTWGKAWDYKLGDTKTVFNSKVDGIPYYKGYTYETIGFNMQLTDPAAAFGREQLKRLDGWVDRRQENFDYLSKGIDWEVFQKIDRLVGASPSWFGFPLVFRHCISRDKFAIYLESKGIRTRPFFAGNILRHKPYNLNLTVKFPIADKLMKDCIFIGVGPWMGKLEMDYILGEIKKWLKNPV